MKHAIYVILLISVSSAMAQPEYLDYAIKKNDTIYGAIREIAPADYALVLPPAVQEVKKVVFVPLRGSSEIRYNDKVYKNSSSEDPIYNTKKVTKGMIPLRLGKFTAYEPHLPDYVLKRSGDTIFQKVSSDKVTDSDIMAYRSNNLTYIRHNATGEFLQLLFDGKVKLSQKRLEQSPYKQIYLDRYRSNDVVYFVEIDSKISEIRADNFPDAAFAAFADNQTLVDLIKGKSFGFENMYLITKFYNQTK